MQPYENGPGAFARGRVDVEKMTVLTLWQLLIAHDEP
jgi:hypothetical protein